MCCKCLVTTTFMFLFRIAAELNRVLSLSFANFKNIYLLQICMLFGLAIMPLSRIYQAAQSNFSFSVYRPFSHSLFESGQKCLFPNENSGKLAQGSPFVQMYFGVNILTWVKSNQKIIIAIWQAVFIKYLEQAVKRIFIKVLGSPVQHMKKLHLLKHFVDNHHSYSGSDGKGYSHSR